MKKSFWNYVLLAVIAVVIIAIDQWTKALVRANLAFGTMWSPWPWLAPYARVVNWDNTGAAFGILQGYNVVFCLLAIAISAAIIYYYPKLEEEDWLFRVALGFVLGGALGNLVDRVTLGRVTDFISVGTFAVFNVADSCITIGVILILLGILIKDQKEKKAIKAEPQEETVQLNQPQQELGKEGDHVE